MDLSFLHKIGLVVPIGLIVGSLAIAYLVRSQSPYTDDENDFNLWDEVVDLFTWF